jgi:hypothetical protein
MTDKDLAFRVVAEGLDIHTPISQVMTKVTRSIVHAFFPVLLHVRRNLQSGRLHRRGSGSVFLLASVESLLCDNRYQCHRGTQQDGQWWIPSLALLER